MNASGPAAKSCSRVWVADDCRRPASSAALYINKRLAELFENQRAPFVVAAEGHAANLASRGHIDVVDLLWKYVAQDIVTNGEPGREIPGELLVDEHEFSVQLGVDQFQGKFFACPAVAPAGDEEPVFSDIMNA